MKSFLNIAILGALINFNSSAPKSGPASEYPVFIGYILRLCSLDSFSKILIKFLFFKLSPFRTKRDPSSHLNPLLVKGTILILTPRPSFKRAAKNLLSLKLLYVKPNP